jgi:SAM-dependent methyltransferase
VSFAVAADAYDRFMGRYSVLLAPLFADFAGIAEGMRVLDVGCGPGALTAELVSKVGARAVTAVDPSDSFVTAAAQRHPGVDVRRATAEQLPFADDTFDVAVSQLVVHFMTDPVAGLGEMARVTSRGGTVAACTWDSSRGASTLVWEAAAQIDPSVQGEVGLPGSREGHLAELFQAAGLSPVADAGFAVTLEHPSFEDWWEPFTLGVGRAGTYVAGLDDAARDELRKRCQTMLPAPPFTTTPRVWAVRATV